jgi:Ser/Thr protein kinase RdoA (MazF antagonist)
VWGENNKFFMKAIPSVFLDTAKQSLYILMYLEEKGFPSPHVISSKNGFPYVEVDELECKTYLVLFDFIDGREPDEGEDVETIGALVGQLHSIMQGYKGSLPVHGKEFFIDRYINILKKKNYDENKIKMFHEYGNTLWKKVEMLPRGFCHGDMHRGNLLRTSSGKYYLLDFDTSCNAFPIYDIMVMCNSTNYFDFDEKGYQKSKSTYESFLKGYTKLCTLSDMELKAFYDLIAIYHYQLQATIIEIYGLDCVDIKFLDKQLDWLMRWREQCSKE